MDANQQHAMSTGSFKLDEGFAEENENGPQIQHQYMQWVNTQSREVKAEIAYEILRTLRSSEIAEVVERLNPLLHMDPIEKLPPEIISQVFTYLDPATLLTASLSSATWRERILDPQLWQYLYRSEGWNVDKAAITAFESQLRTNAAALIHNARSSTRSVQDRYGQPSTKRRATSGWMQTMQSQNSGPVDIQNWREQHGNIEADTDPVQTDGIDSVMADAPAQSPQRPKKRQSHDDTDEMELSEDLSTDRPISESMYVEEHGDVKLNWAHVYKQRHKLEQNWLKGRYTTFQLPHPRYPEEGHAECVYSIQFYGKWLVSGSRDKSLRIWDLYTLRLRGKPLTGHSQSVLCLQFDPTPTEDIIISGSSDSSIIVWRFSTGEKLHTIKQAHADSILNLRFNDKFLVTCSKDKEIKLWNRHELSPLSPDYPRLDTSSNAKLPTHIIDLRGIDISRIETGLANGTYRTLKPFTHLRSFRGHGAAVNAIQIHDQTVVSASGDRSIRLWDVGTGAPTRVVNSHSKGIACVQYDGRRIISGSSDNSVRIFDPTTGTEVASLTGHSALVRTVQANFGDAASSFEEYQLAARAAERQLRDGTELRQLLEDRRYGRRLREGDFGSHRYTMGANLPPGGGGSRWARIVSGSYDESIRIWKRDDVGQWNTCQILKQGPHVGGSDYIEVDHDSHGSRHRDREIRGRAHRPAPHLPRQAPIPAPVPVMQAAAPTSSPGPASFSQQGADAAGSSRSPAGVMSASQIMQATMNTSIASIQASVQNILGASAATSSQPHVVQALNRVGQTAHAAVNEAIASAIANGQSSINTTFTLNSSDNQRDPHQQPQSQVSTPNQPLPGATQVPHAPAPPAVHAAREPSQGIPVARVFKLQFDTRRLICCSQDSRILGWDFANNDSQIEECANLFAI